MTLKIYLGCLLLILPLNVIAGCLTAHWGFSTRAQLGTQAAVFAAANLAILWPWAISLAFS